MRATKSLLVALGAALLLAGKGAWGDAVEGTLYYTTFLGGQNVWKVTTTYDGVGTFSLGAPVNIASTPGADGIVFAPDGHLLIGGQGNAVHKVNPADGSFVSVSAGGASAFHLAVDPGLDRVWATGIPGDIGEVPLAPFTNGAFRNVTGDDGAITGLAFDPSPGVWYYTSSGPEGFGSFGTIDMTTFVTDRLLSNVPAAHGMVYDPFNDSLMLFGDDEVSQYDPDAGAIVSTGVFAGADFDQGAVDGKGHAFVASNDGDLLFVDYSASGLIGALSNFSSIQFLAAALDDVAPLVGPGAPPPPPAVPEPGTLALIAVVLLGLLRARPLRTR
jgi:hypothetical protein